MKDPTAWIPIARETKRYVCRKCIQVVPGLWIAINVCYHRNAWTAYRCRKGDHHAVLFKDDTLHPITIKHIAASNGEQAWLPFPKEDS